MIPLEQCTVVIPAHNEALAIDQVLQELTTRYGPRLALLVVDDGSEDDTAARAQRYAGVRVARHHRRFGYGASIKTALSLAATPYICLFDADGQHQAADVARLLEAAPNMDMVIGARAWGGLGVSWRTPGKLALIALAAICMGRLFPDLNSGLRLVDRELLLQYVPLLPDGFSASTTSTLIFFTRGYSVAHTPIQVRPRLGRSQVRPLRDGARATGTILRMVTLFKPIRFFSLVGALLLAIGVIYGANRLMLNPQVGLSVGSLLIILTGVLVFLFGLIADQIANIRLEQLERRHTLARRIRAETEPDP
ncbi:glycosyltransferase family 2 protein [Magnetofaba australis]|uniref:Putative glycosyl transferase n=1 Tax=Magnetofaba australis IT-1 TaxID=1434232 RepID=A0A1Y2K1K9_9PROT|nr:glycosyltransferase family 2 protein [Magnetofaba australis]OSM01920.1 putative glycosyl transferase [Magnetofaba australis IT-1]